MSRDAGADILNMIYNSEGNLILKNSIDFANDHVFCEWAYLIDLDNSKFEVFEGFDIKKNKPKRVIKSYSLLNMPTKMQLNQDFEEEDED